MRPYGVWAVISPFNFPFALAGGPSSGALVAGNAVVLKPSNQGALMGYKLYECYRDGGVPPGAFHLMLGRGVGGRRGDLAASPTSNGITFTGSYAVGMDIYKNFVQDVPKPVIAEMGGKNPAIVAKSADLDIATDGVLRSAFGFGGQKCSANSRVYVEREVYDDFVQLLKEKTEKLKVGNPIERDVFMGPVVNEEALATFEQAAGEAKKNGTVITGGERLTDGDLERGLFVQPTIVEAPGGQLALEEGAVRAVPGGGAVRRAGRRDREGERHRVRPHGRVLQHGPQGDRGLARQDPGRRRVREPAGGRHDRAPGRASSRSAAGRGRARPARPVAVPTT